MVPGGQEGGQGGGTAAGQPKSALSQHSIYKYVKPIGPQGKKSSVRVANLPQLELLGGKRQESSIGFFECTAEVGSAWACG